ncbi:Crp/Fnr family transcriptional regulator [Paenibacillus glufosinatiresistens]|uniref:Crp/Fnr family transcriptional regulator n=1 Tax=Paenibacillus glufosinatiresistens TaxID=3070657 RepID=UPI00286E9EAC|nr:helix-turn-helix domain-containing protein [Paenibacillus sp. YX.27]
MREINDRSRIAAYLREHGIEEVFHEELLPGLSLYVFEPGESVCVQGQAADTLYVLVRGRIKVFNTSEGGKTLIISFKTPLEVIGDIEYIRGIDIINTVEAMSETHMIGVPYRWLRQHGQSHAPLLNFLLEIIAGKFYSKSEFLSFNLMYPVEVRLASYLLAVSSEGGEQGKGGGAVLINLVDTANLIGTSYRHLNRVLQKFCRDGLIERGRGVLLIRERDRLAEIAGTNIYE